MSLEVGMSVRVCVCVCVCAYVDMDVWWTIRNHPVLTRRSHLPQATTVHLPWGCRPDPGAQQHASGGGVAR